MPRKSWSTTSKLLSLPKRPKIKPVGSVPNPSKRLTYKPQRCQIDPPEQWDSGVEAALAQAIADRTCLSGSYDGEPIREFCPNELGQAKNGFRNVLVYQKGGYSKSGLVDSRPHRCLRVSVLSDLQPAAGEWQEVPGDHANESCVTFVEVTAFDLPYEADRE